MCIKMCIRDRSYARAEAKARNADLIELTPKTPYNRFTAFVRGCLEAVKQKTAYEMESRDWSSDVCSSDLLYLLSAPMMILTIRLTAAAIA